MVILLGIVWGFFEAILGGVLHLIHFPFTGVILGGIGFMVLYYAVKRGVKCSHIFIIPVIAAAIKFSDSLIFHLPLVHPYIVKPAISILMQGLVFVPTIYFIQKRALKIQIPAIITSCVLMVIAYSIFFIPMPAARFFYSIIIMSSFVSFGVVIMDILPLYNSFRHMHKMSLFALSSLLLVMTISAKYLLSL